MSNPEYDDSPKTIQEAIRRSQPKEPTLTLRDQFAMAALTGLIAADTIYYSVGPIVKEAYEAADAMIAERNKQDK